MNALRVETPRLSIAYKNGGPVDGKPLLLLHGWPDDPTTWDGVAPGLQERGYRTFAPWLRGFGPTRFLSDDTPRSGEIAALTRDVLDLADALGLQRFAVVGHDWGARIAYLLACAVPERLTHCVALSVPWQPGPLPTPDFAQAQAFWYQWFMSTERGARAVRDDPKAFARFQWDTWGPTDWFDDAAFDAVAASFDNADWVDITLHAYRVRWEAATPDPQYADLAEVQVTTPSIRVPTLMLQGGADRCIVPAGTAGKEKHFSGPYRRVVLDGVGHFPGREAPREVGRLIAEFLEG
jgi:pimeloyl-ACP methyl ester carboxylesterase